MPDESPGLFHFGKKDEQPPPAPPAPEPQGFIAGVEHLLGKHEEPPPPPPPEKHGIVAEVEHLLGKKEAPPPPPPPPPESVWQRLLHRKPVSPEPASPQRPAFLQAINLRSALYILGFIALLGGIIPGIVDQSYRFLALAGGAVLLLGGILLTGDWHPLTGFLGLRPVRLPGTAGVVAGLAEREAKDEVQKLTGTSLPAEPPMQRLPPWHWPWSGSARAAAQPQEAEQAKQHQVGLTGKILIGIMLAALGHGALTLVEPKYLPHDLGSFGTFAKPSIITGSILLIIYVVTTRVPTLRKHWLSPLGILRRVFIFFIVAALAALGVGLYTHNQELGDAYGQIIGAIAAILAIIL